MVYFVMADHGLIKIGYSKRDLRQRILELHGGPHGNIQPIGIMDGDVETEKGIQARFFHCRVTGEWFRPTDELLDFIAKNATAVQMPPPRKPGRPPLSDKVKESQLRIRLTDKERAILDDAAGEVGTSTWARDVLFREAAEIERRRKRS